jgi:CPA2 family monovalent cation:H+ antiporter-2
MTSLALILLVAAVGHGVSRWLRVPVTPLLLLTGLGLAWSGLLPSGESESERREASFVLALAFLVFAAGMELNPQRFARQFRAVLWVGLSQFVVVAVGGYLLARGLQFTVLTSIYLAMALSTSSTLVVVSHLKQQQQMFEPFARLVIGVLLVQDFLIILVITVLTHWDEGTMSVLRGLAGVVTFGAIALACQRWLLPAVLVRRQLDEETVLLIALGLLFAFVGLAIALDIPAVAGAFLAGFALARFPVNGVVRGLLLSLSDFFQAVFFTVVGTLVMVPDVWVVAKVLLLALVVLLVTPPLVAFLAERLGLNARQAVESGLYLAQTSEFALVLAVAGSRELEHITEGAFSVIALVTVLTMSLTPFVATDRLTSFVLRFHPQRRRPKPSGNHRDHVVMLGHGEGGRWILKPLQRAGYEVLVVDDDPQVIKKLQEAKVSCLRGDGSDETLLERAGANRARLVLASMRRISDAVRVLEHVRGVPVVVRVFEDSEAETIRRLGGIPVLSSEAAVHSFFDWLEESLPQAKATKP